MAAAEDPQFARPGPFSRLASLGSVRREAGLSEAAKVTKITKEVLDTFMGADKWPIQAHKHITFRGEAFDLVSVDGLLEQPIDLTCLESFDVSYNSLTDLKCVEGSSKFLKEAGCIQGQMRFQALRVLKARRNQLEDFVAVLPSLRELDLGHNCLRKLPPTAGFPNLEVLVVAHNELNGSWTSLTKLDKLRKLDMSDNRFNFTPTGFRVQVEALASLSHLVSLRLKDNLFAKTTGNGGCFPEYQTYVLKCLRNLHELDDLADKAAVTQAMRAADAMAVDLDAFDTMVLNRQKLISKNTQGEVQQKEQQVPTWSDMSDALRMGLEDQTVIPKTIKQISRFCSQIAAADPKKVAERIWLDDHSKPAGAGAAYSRKPEPGRDSPDETDAKIQGFLDNFMILMGRVEDNDAWRLVLIRSLAKLSTVYTHSSHGGDKDKRQGLGVKCFQMLGFLMKRSPQAEEEILSVVREIIIEPLSDRSQQDLPVITLQALSTLESSKLPEALRPIVRWLAKMYCEPSSTYPHPDLAKLLAVATCNEFNAKEALRADMWSKEKEGMDCLPNQVIASLGNKKSMAEDCREQYISHLMIMQNIAKVKEEAVDTFEERDVQRDLMERFKDFFGDDIDGNRQKGLNLISKTHVNLRTCAHILGALTALLSNRAVLFDLLDQDQAWGSFDKPCGRFLQYVSIAPKASPVADPLLLAASLRGQLAVLKKYPCDNPPIRNQITAQIVKDLERMKPMLELIDFNSSKYRELYIAADKHLLAKEGRMQALGVVTHAPRFANLHNTLVHECFIAVVELVEYFSAEAQNDRLCAEVSEVMNGQDRETLLFKLLEVPSDPVQDAVMRCFQHIGVHEMTTEEIAYLIKLLENCKDISSEADLLSHVLRQLCQFAGGSEFLIAKSQCEQAINAVMGVFLKNAKWQPYGNPIEERDKLTVSQACISFLQTASGVHDLRSPWLRTKRACHGVVEALKLEDDLCSPTVPDVAVECTWTGRCVETLLQCLSGVERLRAKGKVAFRVLSRIADVLEGNSDMRVGANDRSRNLQEVCEKECLVWDEEKMKADLRFLDDIERDDRTVQQRIFSQYAYLERLVGFLEGLFADEGARSRARMQETAAVGQAKDFLEAVQSSATAAWEEKSQSFKKSEAALVDLGGWGEVSFQAPMVEYAGGRFTGVEDEIDLCAPPCSFDGLLGGAMSIFFIARWDALNSRSRILDFGSGAPKDNIVVGNQGETNDFIFEFYIDSDETYRLTVPNLIRVGATSKFLLTISFDGHMKAWKDGSLVGERDVGCTPNYLQRTSCLVGRSFWSSSEPFCGLITDLKVWQGKEKQWDDVIEDHSEMDGGSGNDDDPPDRQLLMKVFLHADMQDTRPVKQELQGGLNVHTATQQGLVISEQPFADEQQGHMNVAYPVVAMLRCCFAMLKVPASEKIRRDMVKTLCEWLMVARLGTLVGLCGPLDCHVAAKLLRLMSSALELPPSDDSKEVGHAVACHLMAEWNATLCNTAILAARHPADEQETASRGRVLCTEIVRLAAVVCRTIPFCMCSEVKPVQMWFTELYFAEMMPISVIKAIIEMLLYDSQASQEEEKQPAEQGQNEIWELSRVVLSQLLDHCPKVKYAILEVFSATLVSSSMSLRPSFLSALLAQSQQGAEKTDLEVFLNSQDDPARQREGIERVLVSAKVQIVMGGGPLAVQNARHPEACFSFLVTNKGFYIVDITAPGYPEMPTIVQHWEFADLTRLVKGDASQLLYVGVVLDFRTHVSEQFVTLICHCETERNELLSKMHALSEPPGGKPRHRALLQNDTLFKRELEDKVPEGALLTAFVLMEEGLEMFMLSESQVYECAVNFDQWLPPREEADDATDGNPFDTKEDATAHTGGADGAGGKGVAKGAAKAAAKGQGSSGGGSDADRIAARRLKARMASGSTASADSDHKAAEQLITFLNAPRPLELLEKVTFYTERQPRMALFFAGDVVTMDFLDDMTRESWRRCLRAQLSRPEEGAPMWSRSYNAVP